MSMNKILFAAVAASIVGVTVAGCSNDEILSEQATSASNAIGFHLVGSNATTVKRATPILPNTITTTDFDVFAITSTTKQNFMGFPNASDATTANHDGVKINYDGTNWVYATPSEQAYWPSEALDFYAISPAEGGEERLNWLIQPEYQVLTYWVANEFDPAVAAQGANVDVMYAIAKNQTKASNGGKVVMDFKHALSQVVFKAKIAENQPQLKVEINSVKLDCFNGGGTFTFPADGKDATWVPGNPYIKNNPFPVYPASLGVKTVTDVTDAIWLSDETNSMMMIPQTLTPWAVDVAETKTIAQAKNAQQSYLTIECRMYQNGSLLDGFTAGKWTTVYVPFGATLKAGYRHIFTLVFGGGYDANGNQILTPIVVEGDMTTDWVDESK